MHSNHLSGPQAITLGALLVFFQTALVAVLSDRFFEATRKDNCNKFSSALEAGAEMNVRDEP